MGSRRCKNILQLWLAIPSKLQNFSAKVLQKKKRKNCLGFEVWPFYRYGIKAGKYYLYKPQRRFQRMDFTFTSIYIIWSSGEVNPYIIVSSDPKTKRVFFFFCKSCVEEFCSFDGRSGLPTLCNFCYDISSFACKTKV